MILSTPSLMGYKTYEGLLVNLLILAFKPCSTLAILDVIPDWRKWDCIINVIAGERSN